MMEELPNAIDDMLCKIRTSRTKKRFKKCNIKNRFFGVLLMLFGVVCITLLG